MTLAHHLVANIATIHRDAAERPAIFVCAVAVNFSGTGQYRPQPIARGKAFCVVASLPPTARAASQFRRIKRPACRDEADLDPIAGSETVAIVD